MNPHSGEISLNLGLNSKTGEKSPDWGVHTLMLAGAPQLESSGLHRTGRGVGVPISQQEMNPVGQVGVGHSDLATPAGDKERCPLALRPVAPVHASSRLKDSREIDISRGGSAEQDDMALRLCDHGATCGGHIPRRRSDRGHDVDARSCCLFRAVYLALDWRTDKSPENLRAFARLGAAQGEPRQHGQAYLTAEQRECMAEGHRDDHDGGDLCEVL